MRVRILAIVLGYLVLAVQVAAAAPVSGRVTDPAGTPVEGAMVSFRYGDPWHATTVFTDANGRFRTPDLQKAPDPLRVRRVGWQDLDMETSRLADIAGANPLELTLERETNAAVVAAQLPSNRWFALLLAQIENEEQREQFVRQCTYCHQQGSLATRALRSDEQWEKVLLLMARMGAGLSPDLSSRIPSLFNEAYEPTRAVAALTADMSSPDFAPPPAPAALNSVIDEWVLGHAASMQHDLVVHPDGRVYSVDMTQDQLYRLDPRVPDGDRKSFPVPRGDLPLGGVFGALRPSVPNANAHVGPHSLQVAPDGAIWTTLALANQLARFDPASEAWSVHSLETGYYPHTLRFDGRGRIWYTLAASNHVGMYDPATGKQRAIQLPAPTWGQAITSRLLPAFLWLADRIDFSESASAGEGGDAPVPYGIDIAPNGDVWFSQLNAHRIGRIDAETFEVEIIKTPFTGPRRLRFDAEGKLWIPAFSAGAVARFDPKTREFESWPLPIEPLGTETPYALNVNPEDGSVWICGTNSDTLIRFDPVAEEFTIYPLPTQVTYTREIDFDDQGRVWTSNSNMPTWQIEDAQPKLIRLDPDARS
jgi:virginiamycin B lyase